MATVNKPNGKCKADEKVIDLPIGRAAPPIDPADPVALGRDAWQRRRQDASWTDWLLIGEALRIGRQWALEKAETEKPIGKRYTLAFHDWLSLHALDGIDKSDRAKLLQIVDRLDEVEAFRATLTEAERLRLNHPCSVWRRYCCPRRQKLLGYSCSSSRKSDEAIKGATTATTSRLPEATPPEAEPDFSGSTELRQGRFILMANKLAGKAQDALDDAETIREWLADPAHPVNETMLTAFREAADGLREAGKALAEIAALCAMRLKRPQLNDVDAPALCSDDDEPDFADA